MDGPPPTARAEARRGAFPGDRYPEKDLTERIIGCAIQVHRALGPGYVEPIYENALAHELDKQGLAFRRQHIVDVSYDGIKVGQHRVDLLVDGKVVVELKSVECLIGKHAAQVLSTMKAAGARVGLLINFDEARLVDGIRRFVF